MAIHVLPPVPEGPAETDPDADHDLDPFWSVVRRRRPDLPLVLLGEGTGPAPAPDGGGAR